jgi:tripartite ATP-independent transporter DctM subunit
MTKPGTRSSKRFEAGPGAAGEFELLIGLILALLVGLMLIGMPIAFAMGTATVVYLLVADISLSILPQRMMNAVNSFLILAIPLFYLAGELMNACRLTERIVALAKSLVGHFHGGLAQVTVVSGMIFAGISGSATAETAALGSVLIPAMKKEGYDAAFAAAVTVCAAMIGPIIPPSIALVIYGAIANVSIGKLLLGGIVPGVLIGITEMVFVYFLARRRGYPRFPRARLIEVARATWHGLAAVLFPVMIAGGILSGIFTPTEAAAASVLYALGLGFLVYRNLSLGEAWQTFQRVSFASGRVLIIIAVAAAFSWVVGREQVPQAIVAAIIGLTDSADIVLSIIIVLLLIIGLFMIESAALIVLTPILVPVVVQFGIDPVHFGVLMVFVLIVGGGTPPVGVLLFVAQDIAGISFLALCRAIAPFYIPLGVAILLIAFVPQFTLFVPNLIFK